MADTSVKRPTPPENRYRPPFRAAYLGPRFWPTWLGFALLWLMSITPRRLRIALAGGLGRLVMQRNAKRREIVQTNLQWCFPERSEAERERMARDYFRYFTQVVLDTGIFWWASERRFRRNIVLENDQALAASLAGGRRVIIVTCHTLALDRGGVALSADYPFETFVNEARNPLIEWMSARRRVRFGGLVFPRSGGLRPVIRALRQGYALYILTDEDLGPEGSVFAPFFGIPRATLTTPSRLARMSGADVYTSLTYYDDAAGRYVVKIFPQLEGFPGEDEQQDAARLNGVIEQMIREHPEQYMWSLRLFKTFPDGSPPPYRMKGKPGSGPRPRPEGSPYE
ncbi:MAG: lysophospholipid acyltransferase family protein [Pseudomonadota bacterium]